MIKAFDCSTTLTAGIIQKAKAEGFQAVGRYYGTPGSWKLLMPSEARRISDAGLMIFCYFERTAGRALEGGIAGAEDGILAGDQAAKVGQPEDTGITFAVDLDVSPSRAINDYFQSVTEQLAGRYRVGIYAGGDVIKSVRGAGFAEFGILAGAMGWRGSRAYLDSGLWQGRQHPATHSPIGIEIDPVEFASFAGVGAWSLRGVDAPSTPRTTDQAQQDWFWETARDLHAYLGKPNLAKQVQEHLNTEGADPQLRIDGDFGKLSWAALGKYQDRK